METTLAVMERQQQFDFQKNGHLQQPGARYLPLPGHPAHDGHLREIQSRL